MAGPLSYPAQDRAVWEEMNEIVCDIHRNCDMAIESKHDYITYREWLFRRNRLETGKTKTR